MMTTYSLSKTLIMALGMLGTQQVLAQQSFDPGGAMSPEAIQYNYMLDQVRAKGDKGDDLKAYSKQCNDSGICRYRHPRATSGRSVVYHTPYGKQTVFYPSDLQ